MWSSPTHYFKLEITVKCVYNIACIKQKYNFTKNNFSSPANIKENSMYIYV
jgi:hypothetical protein